jgi:Uma2 family endonuclease
MAWKSVPGRDHHLFTIDEYLALERTAEERHEYLNGCVYAMAGESPDHGRICVNLTRRLAEQRASCERAIVEAWLEPLTRMPQEGRTDPQ